MQRQTLVQLARYTEQSPAVTTAKSQQQGSITSKVISTIVHTTESAPHSPSARTVQVHFSLQRQSNTTSPPADIRYAASNSTL